MGGALPSLGAAGIADPAAVPGWVSQQGAARHDVFRVLVEFAQMGDRWALPAVLVCLRPGLCSLAGRIGVPVDEVVSEATFVVLDFPFARRRTVPGQLLLDTRNRFKREGERQRLRETPLGDTRVLGDRVAPGDLGVESPSVERLSELVCRAGRQGFLERNAARLVLETRVWGVSPEEAQLAWGSPATRSIAGGSGPRLGWARCRSEPRRR